MIVISSILCNFCLCVHFFYINITFFCCCCFVDSTRLDRRCCCYILLKDEKNLNIAFCSVCFTLLWGNISLYSCVWEEVRRNRTRKHKIPLKHMIKYSEPFLVKLCAERQQKMRKLLVSYSSSSLHNHCRAQFFDVVVTSLMHTPCRSFFAYFFVYNNIKDLSSIIENNNTSDTIIFPRFFFSYKQRTKKTSNKR